MIEELYSLIVTKMGRNLDFRSIPITGRDDSYSYQSYSTACVAKRVESTGEPTTVLLFTLFLLFRLSLLENFKWKMDKTAGNRQSTT